MCAKRRRGETSLLHQQRKMVEFVCDAHFKHKDNLTFICASIFYNLLQLKISVDLHISGFGGETASLNQGSIS